MDTCAFSEGLARLYAEFAGSIRDNDSESVRNAYKRLRDSGRPITEILNEAIRTIGVSYEELEKHLLGERDPKPTKQAQGVERSIFLEPTFPDSNVKPDTIAASSTPIPVHELDAAVLAPSSTECTAGTDGSELQSGNSVVGINADAISRNLFLRLATWAFVAGIVAFALANVVQTVPISPANNSKLAAQTKFANPTQINEPAVPAVQNDVAPNSSSAAQSSKITPIPPLIGSDAKNGNAVIDPRTAKKTGENTSSAQTPMQVKAEATAGEPAKAKANSEPIITSAAGPQRLISSSDLARRSTSVGNELKPVEAPRRAAAEVLPNTPAGRASYPTGTASNAPAMPPGDSAIDTPVLVERGDSLFRIGDVASARGFYERAAEKGSGQAALRLGESYDLSFLQQANLGSVRADTSAAVFWYRRAWALGVAEAEILLKAAKGE